MRRFVILLLATALGATLLWHFESRRRAETDRDAQERSKHVGDEGKGTPWRDTDIVPVGDGGPLAGGQLEDGADDPADAGAAEGERGGPLQPGEQAFLRGPITFSRRPLQDGEPFVLSSAQDAQPLNAQGTRYRLSNVVVEAIDPEGSRDDEAALRSETTAGTAHIEVDARSIGTDSFAQSTRVSLMDVVVRQFRGTPFAPLTIESKRLLANFGAERIWSEGDEVVSFRSRDLRGSGVGLEARLQSGGFSFKHSADVSVEVGQARVARVTTPVDGPLEILETTARRAPDSRAPKGSRDVQIRATNGVHIELRARDQQPDEGFDLVRPLTVVADSLVLDMRTRPDGERPEILGAVLVGDVTIVHGGDSYTGQSARIEFENGQATQVQLERSPSLTYLLRGNNGEELRLVVSGEGPVTGYIGQRAAETLPDEDRVHFVFAGPGRVEAVDRGGVMTFENEARGQGRRGGDEGTVVVSGGVRIESLEGMLDSESVVATYRASGGLVAASEGPTLLVGRAIDGAASASEYRVRADGGVVARLVGENWFVDRADGVYAESFGADPYRVEAGTLMDVDIAARTFRATGDIDYESLWGRAHAAVAVVRNEASIELVGTEKDPVALDLVPEGETLLDRSIDIMGVRTGWVRAERLQLTGELARAIGGVHAQFEAPDAVWAFDTEELDVRRRAVGRGLVHAGDAGGPPTQGPARGEVRVAPGEDFEFEARFVREARYDTERGNAVFRAARVTVEATATDPDMGDEGAGLDADRPATLRAFGNVAARFEDYGTFDSATGAWTVAQSWDLKADSAEMERGGRAQELDGTSPFRFVAREVSQCRYEGGGRLARVTCDEIEVDGQFGAGPQAASPPGPEPAPGSDPSELDRGLWGSRLVARGGVDLHYREAPDQPTMRGRGETLVLLDGERGRMEAARLKRVRVTGVLPGGETPYQLTAITVAFTEQSITATGSEGSPALLEFPEPIQIGALAGAVERVQAESVEATATSVVFRRNARVFGPGGPDQPALFESEAFTLDPQRLKRAVKTRRTVGPAEPVVVSRWQPPVPVTAASPPPQDADEPQGAPEAQEGDDLASMFWSPSEFTLRLQDWTVSGSSFLPVDGRSVITDASAFNSRSDISFDADWFSLDSSTYLISAGRGVLRGGDLGGWSIEFAAIESRHVDDEVMFTIVAPRIQAGDDSARADYLALWLDAAIWARYGAVALDESAAPPAVDVELTDQQQRPSFFAELLFELQTNKYGKNVRALYMEGNVEVARADRRAARGSKLYLDLPRGVAWLQDAELVYPLESRGEEVPLRVRTDRLETDGEGRLVAKEATLTTCDHDVPHFVVGTRDFSLEPRGDGRWRFGARGNRLRFQGGVTIPLPSIGNLVLDENFGVEGFENEAGEVTPLRDIGIARTARFGTVLGAGFRFDIGGLGEWIAERIGMDSSKLTGKWDTEAKWLGSRGPLFGLGLKLREREPGDDVNEDFRLDAFVTGIPDGGEDRGIVRVPESMREDGRVWGYLRSRYPIVRGEWVDVAFASQTDAGVQPEFYENDYLEFEQRDAFVRWRKSFGADYLTGGAQKRVDDYRSQLEELPSFAAYRGERQVGQFTGLPVLWGGSFDVGYFTRREGELGADLFSDLPGGASLGVREAETGRADLRQRLSLPVTTDLAGIRATPFTELRGTAWSSALGAGDDPARGSARAGVEFATTLHKVTENGYLHALAPRFVASTDLWYDDEGGALIPLDRTELPIDGSIYEVGVRGLWQRPATFENLDIDVRAILSRDRENGVPDTTEVATLSEYITRYGSGEGQIGLRHDGRYNLDDGLTTYTRSALAVKPNDVFLVEFRYGQARDIFADQLFETGGLLTRWRMDDKWELEGRYTHDLRRDDPLLTEITLRRFSHDFVFDITIQDRAGEGGTNFSFSLAPLLGWSRSRLGMLDR